MSPAARQCGFTLGEMLTTLAIAGISLSLAVPGLEALTRGNQLAGSVNQLVATMHIARSEAVTRNARVTVCTSSDGAHCDTQSWEQGWIAFLDADGNAQHDQSEEVLDSVAKLSGIAVRSMQFPNAFTYQPGGGITTAGQPATSGAFTFCEPEADTAARVVILRANGVPTLLPENTPRRSRYSCLKS